MVRKHLSAIKGGRLAAHAQAVCRAFAISDVIGDDLSVIASGPTVADGSTFQDALAVLRRFGGEAMYPEAVLKRLRDSADETPKPGAASLARATTSVIGSRVDAMRGAESDARARGYASVRIDAPITGEARVAARAYFGTVLARVSPNSDVYAIIHDQIVRIAGNKNGGLLTIGMLGAIWSTSAGVSAITAMERYSGARNCALLPAKYFSSTSGAGGAISPALARSSVT